MEPTNSRFVRQYALTKGRANSAASDWPLDTLITTTAAGAQQVLQHAGELGTILNLTNGNQRSIAEISAHLHVHLGIARVLVSDLVTRGWVSTMTSGVTEDGPDLTTLERLLHELQAI